MQAPVDLLLQPVVGQKELISRGGDDKAGGHRQLRQVGGDFPQVGHFAAHRLGQSLVDLLQPQNQFPNVGELAPLQNGADLCFDRGKDPFQGPVAVAREFIEVFDDGIDVNAHRSGVGSDERHFETVAAVEGGLHVGHELQGGVIG